MWLPSGVGGVSTPERGKAGRQAVMLVAWLEGAGEGFKAMTWELVQRRKLRGNPFPPSHSNCTGTCTLSWDHRCQDWAVVNTLPSTPFLSLSSFFFPSLLIHPLSPPFDSSGSVSVGAASKESLEVRQKDQSQVCWGSPVGPWGWAERWGDRHCSVWQKGELHC